MKLSDKHFRFLLNEAIVPEKKYKIVEEALAKGEAFAEDEYKLTKEYLDELARISEEFDPDFENLYEPGDDDWVTIDFVSGKMTVSMSGDQSPYADEMGYEADEEDYRFDAIGSWTIDLRTKEVEFQVDLET